MKVVDLMRQCAKPLIFENADKDYRYSMEGTCFLARFRSGYYAITAKHCLRNRTIRSVRIRVGEGDLTFLPIRNFPSLQSDWNDQDALDLAVFEIESNRTPTAILEGGHFIDLDFYAAKEFRLDPEAILALVGYPSAFNFVNYDELTIMTKGFSPDGHYEGHGEEKDCSKIRFNNLGTLDDVNGLSGSPVFQFTLVDENLYCNIFAGVLIRATKASMSGRFIEAPVVYNFLEFLQQR